MAKRCGVRVLRFSIGYPPKSGGSAAAKPNTRSARLRLAATSGCSATKSARNPGPTTPRTCSVKPASTCIGAAQGSRIVELSGDRAPDAATAAISTARRTVRAAPATPPRHRRPPTDARSKPCCRRRSRGRARFPRQLTALAGDQRAERARSETLLEALPLARFPEPEPGKRIAIVLAGPLANILFAPVALLIVLHVRRAASAAGARRSEDRDARGERRGFGPAIASWRSTTKPDATWDALSTAVKRQQRPCAQSRVRARRRRREVHRLSIIVGSSRRRGDFGGTTNWIIGVMPRGDSNDRAAGSAAAAVWRALVETVNMTGMLLYGIAKIVEGATPVREALGGPIMIAQMAGREAHQGFANVVLFTVMLSLELGIINLLPVPMLDGGHLLFFVVEGIARQAAQICAIVRWRMQVGLFVLVVLMAFVIFNDISRIVQADGCWRQSVSHGPGARPRYRDCQSPALGRCRGRAVLARPSRAAGLARRGAARRGRELLAFAGLGIRDLARNRGRDRPRLLYRPQDRAQLCERSGRGAGMSDRRRPEPRCDGAERARDRAQPSRRYDLPDAGRPQGRSLHSSLPGRRRWARKMSDDLVVTLEWLIARIPDRTVLAGDAKHARCGIASSQRGRRRRRCLNRRLRAMGQVCRSAGRGTGRARRIGACIATWSRFTSGRLRRRSGRPAVTRRKPRRRAYGAQRGRSDSAACRPR